MKVELLDHMGDDLAVVNAARVSFDKESKWYDGGIVGNKVLCEADVKLINYLAKHNHWSPFAHTSIKFRVKAPIFVARQLVKHQVGGVWNEVSRRYVDSEPEFYIPEVWRKRAENVKQGSSEEVAECKEGVWCFDNWEEAYLTHMEDTAYLYKSMIAEGVCPEQARMVLPQSTYTEWTWTGSLVFFHRVFKLRTDPHSQKETQFIAEEIGKHCNELFPVSWKALTNV